MNDFGTEISYLHAVLSVTIELIINYYLLNSETKSRSLLSEKPLLLISSYAENVIRARFATRESISRVAAVWLAALSKSESDTEAGEEEARARLIVSAD